MGESTTRFPLVGRKARLQRLRRKMRNHNPLVQMSGTPERLKDVGYQLRFRSKPPAMSRGRSRLVYQRFAFAIIFRESPHIKL
jgi:hypothetical protein